MPRRPKKMHRGGRQRKPKRRVTRQQKAARAASQPVAAAPAAAGPNIATPRPTRAAARHTPRRRVPARPRASPLDVAAANLHYLPGDLKRIGLVSALLLAVLIVLTIVLG